MTSSPLLAPLAGRYRLTEVIGRGGMAEVHRAVDEKLGRPVAVKLLLDGAGDESDRARFIAEARTLAMLSHSGLVTVLDAGFGGSGGQDQPFLVMELVDGPTLAQLMRRGPMSPEELGAIGVQIADALAYVHARGVIHRDVKPGNVLIGEHDRVKLADFGIARLVEQRTHHTRTGMAIGTAAYVAPEQVSGGQVDVAADIYAFGLVLLEALTGRREYDGPPREAALARLQRPPEIPQLPRWHGLLTAMTSLDPADRPSAGDVAVILRGGLDDPAPVATEGQPDAVTSPILATAVDAPAAEGYTEPMTKPRPAAPAAAGAPRTSVFDRGGDAVAQVVRDLGARARGLSTDALAMIGAGVALVLLFVVMAVARGGDSDPGIPDGTPDQLRAPLVELHESVDEDDGLAASLDRVDAAIETGDPGAIRRTVDRLIARTAQARVDGDIDAEQADRVFDAARELLAELPK